MEEDKLDSIHYHKGIDYFTPKCGEWETATCKACFSIMRVNRDKEGYTGSIHAMSGRKTKFDAFYCPCSGTKWHDQIIAILGEMRRNPSKFICDILQKEIDQILKTREATKEEWDFL